VFLLPVPSEDETTVTVSFTLYVSVSLEFSSSLKSTAYFYVKCFKTLMIMFLLF